MFGLGPQEMIVIGILGVLLFGKRLPEVGRSLGKGIVEFKKGLRGIEDEFQAGSSSSSKAEKPATVEPAEYASVPKFEPPTAAPTPAAEPAVGSPS